MTGLGIIGETDMLQLAMASGVALTRQGNIFRALCPFHRDKDTPSLVIYPATNSWACFGSNCGGKRGGYNGGSVVDWAMQMQGIGFKAAIRWLEAKAGHIERYEPPRIPKIKAAAHSQAPLDLGMVQYWHAMLEGHRAYYHGRGFTDATIDSEMWGWTGKRYSLPVWSGKPGESPCWGVRLRKGLDSDPGPKYMGVAGHNRPTVWGRYHCQGHYTVFAWAGEFDAAYAVQDGLPSFSVVNGVNALAKFPSDWPNLWFPDTTRLVVVFDKKEEVDGGRLARAWNKVKGTMMARVFHWPPQFDGKDYCDWRERNGSARFHNMLRGYNADR